MSRWPQGAHGGTYGGNPIGCAAALATIDVIESEHLADNARDRGRQLVDALAKLQADDAGIGDVRGLGLMVGTELVDSQGGGPPPARTDRDHAPLPGGEPRHLHELRHRQQRVAVDAAARRERGRDRPRGRRVRGGAEGDRVGDAEMG